MPFRTENLTVTLGLETLQTKAELEKGGYRLAGKPVVSIPRLPSRITDLTDDELMELFATIVRWSDHIGGLLALHEVDERFADAAYDMASALILSDIAPSKRSEGSITVAKAEVRQHPQVMETLDRLNQAYARRKVFQMMFANLERDAQLLSRELTRRTSRHDRETRVDRWRP